MVYQEGSQGGITERNMPILASQKEKKGRKGPILALQRGKKGGKRAHSSLPKRDSGLG